MAGLRPILRDTKLSVSRQQTRINPEPELRSTLKFAQFCQQPLHLRQMSAIIQTSRRENDSAIRCREGR